jgi:hypothetical protein
LVFTLLAPATLPARIIGDSDHSLTTSPLGDPFPHFGYYSIWLVSENRPIGKAACFEPMDVRSTDPTIFYFDDDLTRTHLGPRDIFYQYIISPYDGCFHLCPFLRRVPERTYYPRPKTLVPCLLQNSYAMWNGFHIVAQKKKENVCLLKK